MSIKEFKNGNIHIKLECDLLDNDRIDDNELFVELVEGLSMIDTYLFDDIYSFGNFECAIDLINIRINKAYTILLGYDIGLLKAGKTLILKAYNPTREQLEQIEKAGYY